MPLGKHHHQHAYLAKLTFQNSQTFDAKYCAHLPEYLAEVVCKFCANPISDNVTVTSEVNS